MGPSGIFHLPSADLLNDWENLNRGEFIPVGAEEVFGIPSETVAITNAEKQKQFKCFDWESLASGDTRKRPLPCSSLNECELQAWNRDSGSRAY